MLTINCNNLNPPSDLETILSVHFNVGNQFDPRSNAGETKKTCESGEYDCFVLDDNGFILVSEKHEDTGKFFGEVDGMVMEMLVNSDVYKRVRVVDYQAVCYQPVAKTNFASVLSTVRKKNNKNLCLI